MLTVKRLPYIEPTSFDHFDSHQFWKRGLAVTRETGIAFTDYSRMHHEARSTRRKVPAPPFAANDKQLADVIAHRCWRYAHGGCRQMPKLDKKQLKRMTTLQLKQIKDQRRGGEGSDQDYRHQVHVLNVQRIGYVQMQAAVAYRSWRLNQPSTEVAASLGITPWNVRQMIWRLVLVARKLGYETVRRKHVGGKYILEHTQ